MARTAASTSVQAKATWLSPWGAWSAGAPPSATLSTTRSLPPGARITRLRRRPRGSANSETVPGSIPNSVRWNEISASLSRNGTAYPTWSTPSQPAPWAPSPVPSARADATKSRCQSSGVPGRPATKTCTPAGVSTPARVASPPPWRSGRPGQRVASRRAAKAGTSSTARPMPVTDGRVVAADQRSSRSLAALSSTCASPWRHHTTGLVRWTPATWKPIAAMSPSSSAPRTAASTKATSTWPGAGGGSKSSTRGRRTPSAGAAADQCCRSSSSRWSSERIASRLVASASASRTTSLKTSSESGPR